MREKRVNWSKKNNKKIWEEKLEREEKKEKNKWKSATRPKKERKKERKERIRSGKWAKFKDREN